MVVNPSESRLVKALKTTESNTLLIGVFNYFFDFVELFTKYLVIAYLFWSVIVYSYK